MCHDSPVDPDMVVIAESEEFLPYELRVVVCDYGVRDPKAVDDVCEEFDGLFRPNLRDRCWRSLSTDLYHQHKPKKEENIHLYTHIHVQLTCFHVY
jgi:hypothetical protein